ncbi:helix-turn-helix domain-containing protein (plasmid) [Streptomyces cynarae]|uniref:Helix-turn-helix domain-containing protein n=1 Tax=Streptomyces cynarae TaxID=2981134 RepID=A0ABY6EEC0_9ACTN|nr:helix-turn-helix domain-containing protein [Streptomyces cynarae]UXY24915.1 helix-turn-helix domain-containing protein [Streptomyces cynarae]
MTIKHVAMVLEAEGLDGPEKLLLIAYCNRTDDHGYCWPGQQRLADDCGTSIATVKRVKKRLIEKQLIATKRRLDPKTGEPITNLTRVNLELLAAMKRPNREYDDNVVEQLTFDPEAEVPVKRKRVDRQAPDLVKSQCDSIAQNSHQASPDLLKAQHEPGLGAMLSPAPAQREPVEVGNMSPGSVQIEPQTVSQPPQNHETSVLPSDSPVQHKAGPGANQTPEHLGGLDVPDCEGARLLLRIGMLHPEFLLLGPALADQGQVVDQLLAKGWTREALSEIITRPLPHPVHKSVGAVIAARLRVADASPAPHRSSTPSTSRMYRAGDDPVVRRFHECAGQDGLCGRPVHASDELCSICEAQTSSE